MLFASLFHIYFEYLTKNYKIDDVQLLIAL